MFRTPSYGVDRGGKIAIVCDFARAKSVPIEKAVAASFERGRLFGSRAAEFGATSRVNQNIGALE